MHKLRTNDAGAVNMLSGLSDEAFVHRAFISLLRYPCTPALALHYLRSLQSGVSRDAAWKEIQMSMRGGGANVLYDEALKWLITIDGEVFVEQAYRLILGRNADQSGMKHYLDRLASGDGKDVILYSLLNSEEGQARVSHIPYLRNLESRLRRDLGIDNVLTVKKVMDLLTLDGKEFLLSAYKTVLVRPADNEGLEIYGAALSLGAPKMRVLQILAESEEGRHRPKTILITIYFRLIGFFSTRLERRVTP